MLDSRELPEYLARQINESSRSGRLSLGTTT